MKLLFPVLVLLVDFTLSKKFTAKSGLTVEDIILMCAEPCKTLNSNIRYGKGKAVNATQQLLNRLCKVILIKLPVTLPCASHSSLTTTSNGAHISPTTLLHATTTTTTTTSPLKISLHTLSTASNTTMPSVTSDGAKTAATALTSESETSIGVTIFARATTSTSTTVGSSVDENVEMTEKVSKPPTEDSTTEASTSNSLRNASSSTLDNSNSVLESSSPPNPPVTPFGKGFVSYCKINVTATWANQILTLQLAELAKKIRTEMNTIVGAVTELMDRLKILHERLKLIVNAS